MPNWVYNTVEIKGTTEDVAAFMKKATKPYTTNYTPWDSEEPSEQVRDEFSFWNFIRPEEDKLDLYFETNGSRPDPENPGQHIRTGQTEYNWYNWNIANWGCKWDCGDVDIDDSNPENVVVRFNTAWDRPEPVFIVMTEQHPELQFAFEWEEEQGWGGKAEGSNGEFTTLQEWDIPNSHEEYKALDRLDSCNCNHSDDTDDWYDDCPRDEIEQTDGIESKIIVIGVGI